MQAGMATYACSYQVQLHMDVHLHLANITVPASHDKSSLRHSFGLTRSVLTRILHEDGLARHLLAKQFNLMARYLGIFGRQQIAPIRFQEKCQIVPLTRSRTEFQPNRTSTQTTTTFINEMNTAALPRSFARFESS